jgi:hypothetical protein
MTVHFHIALATASDLKRSTVVHEAVCINVRSKTFRVDNIRPACWLIRIDVFGYKSILKLLIKGKAVPLQAWSGPEGSGKLRFPYFTTTQDGNKVVSLKHRPPLPPGNTPGTHFC